MSSDKTSSCPFSGSCSGYDLIMWKNKVCSGVVFGTGLLLYSALYVFDYSLILLACRIVQLSLIAAVVAKFAGKPCTAKQEDVDAKIKAFAERLEVTLVSVGNIAHPVFLANDLVLVGKAFAAVTLVGAILGCVSTATLVLVAFLGTFLGPFIYNEKKDVIDPVLKQVKDAVEKNLGGVLGKIPAADKVKSN